MEEPNYEDEKEEKQASFNMALSCLERLNNTLIKIRDLSISTDYSEEQKQEMKVQLTKQFFIQSTPLLKSDVVSKYQEEILNLKPDMIKMIKKMSAGCYRVMGYNLSYNSKLDKRLDQYLIELQIELQKEGHFMPSADESSMF